MRLVASNRKTAALKKRPVKAFKPTSADYDARIFSYREKDQTVSLSTVGGRVRVQLILGDYQIGKLKGKTPTSATLSKHRDGKLYIHIQIKQTAPTPRLENFGGNVRYKRLGRHGAYKLRGKPTQTAPPQATRTPETDTATPVPPLGETTAVAPLGETPRPHCLPRPDWLKFPLSCSLLDSIQV